MGLLGNTSLPRFKQGLKEYTHESVRNTAEQPVITCKKATSLVGFDPLTRNLYRLEASAQSTGDSSGKTVMSSKSYPCQDAKAKHDLWTLIFQDFFQCLAVFYHIITIYPVFLAIFILLPCAILRPLSTIIPLAVSVFFSYIIPKRPRMRRLRSNFIWRLLISYFPIRLYRSTKLPPTKKYIFGCHPHGVLSYGVFTTFATDALGFGELFPGIEATLLTLDSNFRIPVFRDYLLAMGFGSASRESIEEILTKRKSEDRNRGQAVAIVVGGAKESLEAIPGTLRTVIKNRKGFIRLAIRTGADIVPVLVFGENDVYDAIDLHTRPLLLKVQLLFKKVFGFTIPFFYTRGPFRFDLGIMPHRRPINVVIGRPIESLKEQQDNIDARDIDEVHERYMRELEHMWDEWKDVFAPNRREELTLL